MNVCRPRATNHAPVFYIRTVNKPSYLEAATRHPCDGCLLSNLSGGRTAAWKMGDEEESLVSEESRQNYGSFCTNGLRNYLYRDTTDER